MKKYVSGLVAVLIAVSASAFTKASEKAEGEYFLDPESGLIVPITTEGQCLEGEEFCKYTLKENAPDDGNPEHYDNDGIPGRQWVPSR